MEARHYFSLDIIKAIMKEKGISARELARLAGVSVPTIKRFLNGADQKNMQTSTFVKISSALETPLSELLNKERENAKQ